MIQYGATTLNVKQGTVVITQSKVQSIRHYPGTDLSDIVSLGKPGTRISFTLQALTEADRILYESILQSSASENLIIDARYYKLVTPGEYSNARPLGNSITAWNFDAEFIALDPKPYSVVTDEVLY